MPEIIPITDLAFAITSLTGVQPTCGHRKFQQLACDAKLPSAHRIRGRWHVTAEAIPAIIEAIKSVRYSSL